MEAPFKTKLSHYIGILHFHEYRQKGPRHDAEKFPEKSALSFYFIFCFFYHRADSRTTERLTRLAIARIPLNIRFDTARRTSSFTTATGPGFYEPRRRIIIILCV